MPYCTTIPKANCVVVDNDVTNRELCQVVKVAHSSGFTKLRRTSGRQQKKPACPGWHDPGMPGKSSYNS